MTHEALAERVKSLVPPGTTVHVSTHTMSGDAESRTHAIYAGGVRSESLPVDDHERIEAELRRIAAAFIPDDLASELLAMGM